jgi:hypothetical protein
VSADFSFVGEAHSHFTKTQPGRGVSVLMRRFSSAASGNAIIVVVVVLAFLVGPNGGLIVN